MLTIPWYLKIIVLLLGIKFQYLGIILTLLDGYFHSSSDLDKLKKSSPDWIIARLVFGGNGLSEQIHKIMGYLLILGSLLAVLYLITKSNRLENLATLWFNLFQPITLIIISFAIFLKNVALITNGLPPDNTPVAFL